MISKKSKKSKKSKRSKTSITFKRSKTFKKSKRSKTFKKSKRSKKLLKYNKKGGADWPTKPYECPICMLTIDPNLQNTFACTQCSLVACMNCIHKAINYSSFSNKCPQCRQAPIIFRPGQPTPPTRISEQDELNFNIDELINLISLGEINENPQNVPFIQDQELVNAESILDAALNNDNDNENMNDIHNLAISLDLLEE
uniref:RING-type domain-containing protein n=1 Tax=viral metagenome TaxID=1070528 RepID=A0A6C0AZ66_9ZZZZ|tara:strand:+ start:37690 stop:38286 length:597 start_codon:yes stop_codon:yes gene_type:complete